MEALLIPSWFVSFVLAVGPSQFPSEATTVGMNQLRNGGSIIDAVVQGCHQVSCLLHNDSLPNVLFFLHPLRHFLRLFHSYAQQCPSSEALLSALSCPDSFSLLLS